MKPSDIREKSQDELAKLAVGLEEELFMLRFKKGANQLKQVSNIRKTKRDLARVRTILRERSLKEAKREAS